MRKGLAQKSFGFYGLLSLFGLFGFSGLFSLSSYLGLTGLSGLSAWFNFSKDLSVHSNNSITKGG